MYILFSDTMLYMYIYAVESSILRLHCHLLHFLLWDGLCLWLALENWSKSKCKDFIVQKNGESMHEKHYTNIIVTLM